MHEWFCRNGGMDGDNNLLTIPLVGGKMTPTQIVEHFGGPAVIAVSRAHPWMCSKERVYEHHHSSYRRWH